MSDESLHRVPSLQCWPMRLRGSSRASGLQVSAHHNLLLLHVQQTLVVVQHRCEGCQRLCDLDRNEEYLQTTLLVANENQSWDHTSSTDCRPTSVLLPVMRTPY